LEEEEEVTQIATLSQLEKTRKTISPVPGQLRKRPDRLTGSTYQYKTDSGLLYVTINEDALGPFELFAQLAHSRNGKKSSAECNELLTTLARMVSYSFQQGIDPQEISSNLNSLSPASDAETLSITEALSSAILQHVGQSLPSKPESSLEGIADSHSKETPYSIFEEVALQQDHLPEFSKMIPPTASCVDCGKPFKKLNGSDSCSDCKAAH
jgi:hypothetical protein